MDIVPDISHVIRHGDVDFTGSLQTGRGGIIVRGQCLRRTRLQPGGATDTTCFLPRTAGVEVAANIRSPEAGPLPGQDGFAGGSRVEFGDHDGIPAVIEIAFHGGGGNSILGDGNFFADAAGQAIVTEAESDGIQGCLTAKESTSGLGPDGGCHTDQTVFPIPSISPAVICQGIAVKVIRNRVQNGAIEPPGNA